MIEVILMAFIVSSWIFWLLATVAVYQFFRRPQKWDAGFTPPVSILKAVKGIDAFAYENFASFCKLDYPEYELLFGVAEASDPVIPLVQQLQRDFPQRRIRLYVTPPLGPNRKASILHYLAGQAQYEILVASDSDMRVRPDYLRRVVAPLADPRVGLVTCPYRGRQALSLPAHLEALHMSVTFIPSVIVARLVLPISPPMGASMAMRRRDLEQAGGFAAVADYLADDYQIGAHIASLGLSVHLSDYIMDSVLGETVFDDQWYREVRWMRCARMSRPLEYPAMVLTFSTPLALVLLFVSGFDFWGWLALVISAFLRWGIGWLLTGWVSDLESRPWLLWLPVRDMLSAATWCAAAFGRRVFWRGEEFRLVAGGRLEPVASAEAAPVGVAGPPKHGT